MEINRIVTYGGRTLDFHGGLDDDGEPRTLSLEELELVPDEGVIRLLTPAFEAIILKCCENLTDASIAAVAENCRNLEVLDVR